jgi:soluble lytic murein transglycosylase-like protein
LSASASSFPNRYDRQIRKAVKFYWPDRPDWKEWKAQLYQESRLRPGAVSPVGAAGLAQFMPATWREMRRVMQYDKYASPYDADLAIEAGAYYMRRLRIGWSSPRPPDDRQQLAQASYNAGMGNMIRAQKACGMAVLYDEIIVCLPDITGRHADETIDYVRRIRHWRSMMEAE